MSAVEPPSPVLLRETDCPSGARTATAAWTGAVEPLPGVRHFWLEQGALLRRGQRADRIGRDFDARAVGLLLIAQHRDRA
jgi:hypothetical protein